MTFSDFTDEDASLFPSGTSSRFSEWRDEVFPGQEVVGRSGGRVGRVKEILEDGLRVAGAFAGDIWLPYSAVADVLSGQIRLNIPAREVGMMRGTYPRQTPTQGPYVGVGPRGYRRTDERIRQDLNDRLWASGQLDASGIDVSVQDGIITLNGLVDSRWSKRRAEDLAWNVPGATDVINNLHLSGGMWDNWRKQMSPGMDVVGIHGSKIGTVDEIRDYQFLALRTGDAGLWIPFTAIQDVRNERVILNVTRDETNNMSWPTTNTQPA